MVESGFGGRRAVSHFLYVVCHIRVDELRGPCKVGVTSKPKARLNALKTASPRRLVFAELWDFPDRAFANEAEKLAHASLQRYRMNGEWFDIGPTDAVQRIELWMMMAAIADAQSRGQDPDSIEMVPGGVGLIANGMASQIGFMG
jgi:Meiotically up-regulated gene 113